MQLRSWRRCSRKSVNLDIVAGPRGRQAVSEVQSDPARGVCERAHRAEHGQRPYPPARAKIARQQPAVHNDRHVGGAPLAGFLDGFRPTAHDRLICARIVDRRADEPLQPAPEAHAHDRPRPSMNGCYCGSHRPFRSRARSGAGFLLVPRVEPSSHGMTRGGKSVPILLTPPTSSPEPH